MLGRTRFGRWLLVLLPVLIVTALLPGRPAFSGGEVDLKQYISKSEVSVGEAVTFGVGAIPVEGAVVRWNFGDGSPEENGWPVIHVYKTAGEYEVTAVVTYQTSGSPVPTIPTRIRVKATGNTAPQARGSVTPSETLAGLPVSFDATTSADPNGQIARYLWNFDDGTTSTEAQTQHSYNQAGTYHIILTVTDNGEMDATALFTVTITALPVSVLPGAIGRALPAVPKGASPPLLPPMILVDMGVWEVERFPYWEYTFEVTPPINGVAVSNRDWLTPDPTDFEYITGTPVLMTERISLRNTSLLPRAHTSWGAVILAVNGRIAEIPVAATVRGPEKDISGDVWTLFGELRSYLEGKGQLNALVYTLKYPDGADFSLGLITEYVIEEGYGGQMPRDGFVVKVAELLMDRDENGDGVVGFTDQDRGLGVKVGH